MSETWEHFASRPLTNQKKKEKKKKKKKLALKVGCPLCNWKVNSAQSTLHTKHNLGLSDPAPWLHEFCFRWTSAHPITKPGAVRGSVTLCFLAHPAREIFFTRGPTLLTQLPCSKTKFSPTLLLYLCYDLFFSKLSFFLSSLSLLLLQIEKMVPLLVVAVDVLRRTRSCYNFKVCATQHATSSRRQENKVNFLHIFCT